MQPHFVSPNAAAVGQNRRSAVRWHIRLFRAIGVNRPYLPHKWLSSERVRPMCFFPYRSADAIAPKQRAQTRERFIKLPRISERRFK